MYILELNYQEDNHYNFQSRIIEIESFDKYISCLKGEVEDYSVSRSLKITETKEEYGFVKAEKIFSIPKKDGTFTVKIIHEAHVMPEYPVVKVVRC